MSYIREQWIENETPLSADNMNRIEDGIEEALFKTGGNTEMWEYIRNLVYPVGSIYMSVRNVDPGTLFGGTWVAWGKGRVPVGVDGNQTEFNSVEKESGGKTVTLTTNNLPGHTHSYEKANPTSGQTALTIAQIPSHAHEYRRTEAGANLFKAAYSSSGTNVLKTLSNQSNATTVVGSGAAHAHSVGRTVVNTSSVGSGTAVNNLQPYITCYMWKRTG